MGTSIDLHSSNILERVLHLNYMHENHCMNVRPWKWVHGWSCMGRMHEKKKSYVNMCMNEHMNGILMEYPDKVRII